MPSETPQTDRGVWCDEGGCTDEKLVSELVTTTMTRRFTRDVGTICRISFGRSTRETEAACEHCAHHWQQWKSYTSQMIPKQGCGCRDAFETLNPSSTQYPSTYSAWESLLECWWLMQTSQVISRQLKRLAVRLGVFDLSLDQLSLIEAVCI